MNPPEGTRLALIAENLLETLGTRSESGNRLSFKWGVPDANGWYTPMVSELSDDNLVAAYQAELRAKVEGLLVHSISGYEWECGECHVVPGGYVDSQEQSSDHDELLMKSRILALLDER